MLDNKFTREILAHYLAIRQSLNINVGKKFVHDYLWKHYWHPFNFQWSGAKTGLAYNMATNNIVILTGRIEHLHLFYTGSVILNKIIWTVVCLGLGAWLNSLFN